MLTGLLGDLAKVVRGKGPGSVKIENKVFKLHYRFTTCLFLGFSILVTASNFIGEPVKCHQVSGVPSDLFNTQCWIQQTYIWNRSQEYLERFDYSPDAYNGAKEYNRPSKKIYQSYYQWVPFMLALFGVLFYIPHWLWVISEDGRMKSMITAVRLPVQDDNMLRERVDKLAAYLRRTLGSYKSYVLRFIICDAINIFNVIITIFLLDLFLNGNFLNYGSSVARYLSGLEKENAFAKAFPTFTNCDYRASGPGGEDTIVSAKCLLAHNILNEKIFLVLWFWLIILAVLSVLVFVGRLVLMVCWFRVYMLESSAHTQFSQRVRRKIAALELGDFFLLSLIARNIDATAFHMLIKALTKEGFKAQNSTSSDSEGDAESAAGSEIPLKRRAPGGGLKDRRVRHFDD